MYTELPAVTATPADRLQALKDAKELLAGTPETTTGGIFGGSSTKPRDFFDPTEGIRLAEYITTGHDYKDTHPEGKRRPIQRITNITMVAPPSVSPEDLEHFMHHVSNGDVAEFFENLLKQAAEDQPSEGDGEESAGSGDAGQK